MSKHFDPLDLEALERDYRYLLNQYERVSVWDRTTLEAPMAARVLALIERVRRAEVDRVMSATEIADEAAREAADEAAREAADDLAPEQPS